MADTQNKCKHSDSDSTQSVVSVINLGDVGNTMNENSSNDDERRIKKSVKRLKVFHTNRYTSSETEDSDCKITGYKPPPKQVKEQDISSKENETLYQNQMMDREIERMWQDDLDYYGDNETDNDSDKCSEQVKETCLILTMHSVFFFKP